MADSDLRDGLNRALVPATPIFSDRDSNSPLEKFLEAPPQAELEKILGFPLDEDRLQEFLAQEKSKRESEAQDAHLQTLPEKLGACFLDVHKALSQSRTGQEPGAKPPKPDPKPEEATDSLKALLALTDGPEESEEAPTPCPEEPAPPCPDALTTTPAKLKTAPIVISPETVSCQDVGKPFILHIMFCYTYKCKRIQNP